MRRPLLAAALVLAVAGCGSTVQLPADQSGNARTIPSSGELGLSVPTVAPLPAGTSSSPGGSDGLPTPSRSSAVGHAEGPSRSTSATPATPATSRASSSPTADHSPIRVGLVYAKDIAGAAAAIGLGALSTGDTLAQTKAVAHWVNNHGGVGGHPIELFSYSVSSSSGNSVDAAAQAACTALTQDDHVRFMLTIANLPPSALPCYARAGVGVLDDESGVSGSQLRQYSGYLAGPADFSLGRSATNLVDDLWRRGWLTSKSKVGALATDIPQDTSIVSGALTRALAAHGLKIAATASVPNSTGTITAAPGIALKFRTAGVDRVIPIGASPLFLMIAAATQGYHPAYAVTSLFGPGALIESTAPKVELANSAGIGWQPFLDVARGKHPAPVSSNETLCFKLMTAAGQASTSATTKGFQAQVCDLVFYLKAMGDALPTLPGDLFAAARSEIGTSFRSAATFRSDMRERPDGVAAYRDLAYQSACSCYQYVGPLRRTTS